MYWIGSPVANVLNQKPLTLPPFPHQARCVLLTVIVVGAVGAVSGLTA